MKINHNVFTSVSEMYDEFQKPIGKFVVFAEIETVIIEFDTIEEAEAKENELKIKLENLFK
jgi:hypothetical protein